MSGLPPTEVYQALAAWVLSSAERRRCGSRATSFRRGPDWVPAPRSGAGAGGRGAELGKLDELADRVAKTWADTDFDRRNQLALRGLIAIARADHGAARALLGELATLAGGLKADAPLWQRWPSWTSPRLRWSGPSSALRRSPCWPC